MHYFVLETIVLFVEFVAQFYEYTLLMTLMFNVEFIKQWQIIALISTNVHANCNIIMSLQHWGTYSLAKFWFLNPKFKSLTKNQNIRKKLVKKKYSNSMISMSLLIRDMLDSKILKGGERDTTWIEFSIGRSQPNRVVKETQLESKFSLVCHNLPWYHYPFQASMFKY